MKKYYRKYPNGTIIRENAQGMYQVYFPAKPPNLPEDAFNIFKTNAQNLPVTTKRYAQDFAREADKYFGL